MNILRRLNMISKLWFNIKIEKTPIFYFYIFPRFINTITDSNYTSFIIIIQFKIIVF